MQRWEIRRPAREDKEETGGCHLHLALGSRHQCISFPAFLAQRDTPVVMRASFFWLFDSLEEGCHSGAIHLSNVLEPEATLEFPLFYPPSAYEELRAESGNRHCRQASSAVPALGLDTAAL